MDFTLDVVQKRGYLHITVTGSNSPETVAAYLEQVVRKCIARQCHKVLIEERLDGPRLGFSEIAELAAESSKQAVGTIHALAYVDVNAKDDSMQFAELVARNRSAPVRVFGTVAEAEIWIGGEKAKEQVH